ncbi:peptidase A4 family-domain-containing protein [Xylariaceae sp. FL1019]|nr:peptidase A4 family-domain-containing protein [Xylariaceae sp. FL1019]
MRASSPLLALLAASTAVATYSAKAHDASGNEAPVVAYTIPVSSVRSNGALTKFASNDKAKRQDVTTSGNWCGAVQLSPPSGTFNYVAATFPVANISSDTPDGTGPDDEYFLYEWVGIDGFTGECSGLIQSGTGYWINQGSGTSDLFVWAYFWPDPEIYGLDIAGGYFHDNSSEDGPDGNSTELGGIASVDDLISVKLTVESESTGTAVIENLTQGGSITSFINGTEYGTLCGKTAEWIAENPLYTSESFPKFSTINFTDCATDTTTGETGSLDGVTLIYGNDLYGGEGCMATELSTTDLEVYWSG